MRRLALLLALAAVAAPAAAQVSLGVRGGIGAATLNLAEEGLSGFDFEDRYGFTGGITAELPLSDVFALRTELVYTMKGATRQLVFDETIGLPDYDVTLDLDYAFDYVELPVLVVVTEPTPVGDLAVFFGPTLSLNVRERVDAQATGTIEGVPLTDEQAALLIGPLSDEWVEAMDLGATLGTRAVRGRLAVEARFTLGLPVVSTQNGDGSGFIGVKNRAFAVSVGYTLF